MSPERLDAVVSISIRHLTGGSNWPRGDLYQEGCLIAIELMPVANAKANPDGFLVTAVRRRLIDRLRRDNGRYVTSPQKRRRLSLGAYGGRDGAGEVVTLDVIDEKARPEAAFDARDEWADVRQKLGNWDAGVLERWINSDRDTTPLTGVLSALNRARRLMTGRTRRPPAVTNR